MWNVFLTVSGSLFWLALLGFFLFEALLLRNKDNSPGAVALGIIVFAVVLLFTDAFHGWSPLWLIGVPVLYVAIGIAWALFKWRQLILAKKAEVRARYDAGPTNPAVSFEDFAKRERPTAVDNAGQISAWMALWFWSMSWIVLQWPWRFITWTYDRLSTVFERWSEKLWKD